MKINREIFKAYDIRGIYPEQLNEEISVIIVKSLVEHFNPGVILISKDTRKSSPSLFRAIIKIIPSHIKTFYIELATTPLLYFWAGKLNVDLSIMITASHNPRQYNGYKISGKNVYPISGQEIFEIIQEKKIEHDESKNKVCEKNNLQEIRDAITLYNKFLLEQIKRENFKKILHIAIDCANGTSGIILTQLLKELPIKAEFLCLQPDGNFPNHDPNPLIFENIKHLSDFIKKENCDLGVAFDGDADRVIFLDENGKPVPSDLLIIYLAQILKKTKNIEKVFIDTRSSQAVIEELEKIKLKVERIKAGHLFMRRKLNETQSCFAGELSGHFYYKDNYNADAAILTMLLVIEQLATENRKISQIIKQYKKYESTGELSYTTANKEVVLNQIDKYFAHSRKEFIDGISIYEDDFYMNIRKSNTEDVVRVIIEAKSKNILEKIKAKIEQLICSI
ncbi:MAG: phosphomannomutase/phosphoglucomutase [Planctomycetota bacterium]